MSTKARVAIGAIITALMALIAIAILNGSGYAPWSKCEIGVTGTAASIEFTGSGAGALCNTYFGQASGPNPNLATQLDSLQTQLHTSIYQLSSDPTGTELCEGNAQRMHHVVRDSGMLMLVGNVLCRYLGSQGG